MKLFAAAVALWLAAAVASLLALTRQPWLGLEFSAAPGDGIRVAAVDPKGPAWSLLKPGDTVLGLRGRDGVAPVSAADLNPDPSYLNTYAELDRFLAKQDHLASLLRSPPVIFVMAGGVEIAVRPLERRPWSALPPVFLLQALFIPGVALGIAAAMLRRQPRDRATRYFVGCVAGYAVMVMTHAIYSADELALPRRLFEALLSLNHDVGLVIVIGCSWAMLWNYPTALGSQRWIPWMFGAWALFALLHELRLLPTLNFALRGGAIVGFVVQALLCLRQWHRARGRPAHRAVLKWLIMPWFGCMGLYYLLLFLPSAAGFGPQAPQIVGWALMLMVIVGLALGLSRFRLYFLNPANVLVWIVNGLGVAGLIAILVKGAAFEPFLASCLALAAAGAFHGYVRDAVWAWQGLRYADFERVLKIVLPQLLGCRTAADVALAWRTTLEILFDPRFVAQEPAPEVRIGADGEWLETPSHAGATGLRLGLPFRGRGLFMPEDAALVGDLWKMFDAVARYWEGHLRGQRQERFRIVRHIEAFLQHPFAAVRSRSRTAELARLAAETESELRRVAGTLLAGQQSLHHCLPEWREEVNQRCAAAGICAEFGGAGAIADVPLDVHLRLNLHNVLREAVTNAIRHSGGSRICWTVQHASPDHRITLTVEDDGVGRCDAIAQRRGLLNMERRAHELGGRLRLDRSSLGGLRVTLECPVTRTGDAVTPRSF